MAVSNIFSKVEIESIYSAANSAIWHSHHWSGDAARIAAREEDYVASLVRYGVPLLARGWSPILEPKGIGIRVSGVFCHGHPQVEFVSGRGPIELADLLIVHQHTGAKRATARAMLVQAKMSTDATHRLRANDDQLALFSQWPRFRFISGGLDRRVRDLEERGKGSRYALVLKRHDYPECIGWADQCPWTVSPAVQHLSGEVSLARLLGNMILNKDGRPVGLRRPRVEWSKTVKELLEITGQRTFSRKNIGFSNAPRRFEANTYFNTLLYSESASFRQPIAPTRNNTASATFFGVGNDSVGTDDQQEIPPHREDEPGRDGGISTLILETQELD